MSEILKLLQQAKAGNKDATAKIVEYYMPTILSNSRYDNAQVNEDCRQFIILNLVMAISKFKPMINNFHDNQND